LSELSRRHTQSKVETSGSFDQVARSHKRRGNFLGDELKERGIIGEFAVATRIWKPNEYGLKPEQVDYAAGSFLEIAERYGLNII
jgi:Sep-tRNA:Cys-tRNA synthetase